MGIEITETDEGTLFTMWDDDAICPKDSEREALGYNEDETVQVEDAPIDGDPCPDCGVPQYYIDDDGALPPHDCDDPKADPK
ncbi:MAG: hypothetical protein QGI09_07490 [Dehalococcoidia bacterium]|nr:hypothetical protein [Dehalococcoidia bacterium]